jgi:hypothetical protein
MSSRKVTTPGSTRMRIMIPPEHTIFTHLFMGYGTHVLMTSPVPLDDLEHLGLAYCVTDYDAPRCNCFLFDLDWRPQ